ncbi:MAG: sodium:solute symporter family protein [Streptosporangiales bacterium]
MSRTAIILIIAAVYVVVLAAISIGVRKYARTSSNFTTGARVFPAAFIGFLMASEFIGTSATLGTAQRAYEDGISAAWNIVALSVGFVLFGFLLSRRYKAIGENTISAVMKRGYGEGVRRATSAVMVIALLIIGVAMYVGGAAIFSSILGVNKVVATVLTGVIAVVYVGFGGMRSVVYTNVLHALILVVGIVIAAVVPLNIVGGFGELQAQLPASFFSWHAVGFGQIVAWVIAGAGAIFVTQYIVQAIYTVSDARTAKRAGFYSAIYLIPYALLAAVAGMCAAVLFPNIESVNALPVLVTDMNVVLAGLVICGLLAGLLGTVSATTLAISTLLLKDFYRPFFNAAGDERKDLWFVRGATVAAGLVPIVLALYGSNLLAITFLAKGLRASLAVLVVLMFFAPRFGTRRGALVSIIAAIICTLGWFLAGNPFGVDDAYIAVGVPLLVMAVSQLWRLARRSGGEPVLAEPEHGHEPAPEVGGADR